MFCYEISRRPLFKTKIEILVLRSTLPVELSNYDRLIDLVLFAVKSLTETYDEHMKLLLFKTLQCGNFLNQVVVITYLYCFDHQNRSKLHVFTRLRSKTRLYFDGDPL